MSTTSTTNKFLTWILPGLITGLCSVTFSKVNNMEEDIKVLLVATGVNRTEIDNIKDRINRESNNDNKKPVSYNEPSPFITPERINLIRLKQFTTL